MQKRHRFAPLLAFACLTLAATAPGGAAEPARAAKGSRPAAVVKRCDTTMTTAGVVETIAWTGQCIDGKFAGKGVMTWTAGDKVQRDFEGELANGLPLGKGLLKWADGRSYEGDFQEWIPHGRGVMKFPDSRRFEGEFAAGEMQGGALYLPGGERFDGPLVAGLPEGNGRVLKPNGDAYDAIFKAGQPVGVASYSFGGERKGGRFIGLIDSHAPHGDGVYFNLDGSSFPVRFDRGNVVSFGEFKYANGDRWQGPINGTRPGGKGALLLTNGDKIEGVFDKEQFQPGARYSFAKGGVFSGAVVDRKPQGTGLLRLANGDRIRGQYSDGALSGNGQIVLADGRRYEGGIEQNLPKGNGVLRLPSGEKIEATFDGTLDVAGKLKISFPNGDSYIGETKGYRLHGEGDLKTRLGHRYIGAFKEGIPGGAQEVIHADGTTYLGAFRDGERAGGGLLVWPDGTRYEGQFAGGLPHGKGNLSETAGLRYNGEFQRGLPNGRGRLELPSGRVIDGAFRDGLADGQGTITQPDKSRFSGKFAGGEPDGAIAYVDGDGKTHELVFQRGIPKSDDGPFFSLFKNKAEELGGLIEAGFYSWAQSYALKHEKWFAERPAEAAPLFERLRAGLAEVGEWRVRHLRVLAQAQLQEVGRIKGDSGLTQARTMLDTARKVQEGLRNTPLLKPVADRYADDPGKVVEPMLVAAASERVVFLISLGQLEDAQRAVESARSSGGVPPGKAIDAALAELFGRAPLVVARQLPAFDQLREAREIIAPEAVKAQLQGLSEQALADGEAEQSAALLALLKELQR